MYVTEDNIDFYNELNSSDKDIIDNLNNSSYCLISNLPLLSDSVLLSCGHNFNYGPLLNDIKNHKNKFNSFERHSLNTCEIRCPYCRTVHKQLLPPNEQYPKIHGVNFFDEILYLSQLNKKNDTKWYKGFCSFSKKHIYDSENDNNEIIPQCSNTYVTYLEIFKCSLCHTHKTITISNYLKHKKLQHIAAKKKLKEEAQLHKIAAKKQLKEDTKLIKSALFEALPFCSVILQTGKNKGNNCSYKCINNTLFCSRHSPKKDTIII